MKAIAIFFGALALWALAGCNAGTVSQSEMEQVRKEMSNEAYEAAMKKAGRGAELEAEQRQAEERRRMSDGG